MPLTLSKPAPTTVYRTSNISGDCFSLSNSYRNVYVKKIDMGCGIACITGLHDFLITVSKDLETIIPYIKNHYKGTYGAIIYQTGIDWGLEAHEPKLLKLGFIPMESYPNPHHDGKISKVFMLKLS